MQRRADIPLTLALAALLAGVLGCKEIEQAFIAKDTPPEPCDPTYSTYHGYVHFVERDFLTRDQTLDYRKWFEANRVDASECDPLRVRAREEAALEQQSSGPVNSTPPATPEPAANTPPPMKTEKQAEAGPKAPGKAESAAP